MWLAVAIRVFTLWLLLLPGDWFLFLTSDVYWGTRQGTPEFVAFQQIRDDVDRAHEAWLRGEFTDEEARESARGMADRLRHWEERAAPEFGLFTLEEKFSPNQTCPPFYLHDSRLALLDIPEAAGGGDYFCGYLVFVF